MTETENHFTVFIRLPYPRADFVDPPAVAWSAAKERDLWDAISRQSKGNEIDWKQLSEQFQVTETFLLQQAAWLYERQLSQVRAQMRRMGSRQTPSASVTPAPGSTSASMIGAQPMRRMGSGGSRVPSRLSTQIASAINTEGSTPTTPARSRISLPLRNTSVAVAPHSRGIPATAKPLSRQPSRENEVPSRTHSRRGSIQHQTTRSPNQHTVHEVASSSDEEVTQSRIIHRRPNPSSIRRTQPTRKPQHTHRPSIATAQVEEDDDEDSPAFLPLAVAIPPEPTRDLDPSATLRGGFTQTTTHRPTAPRRSTSERIQSHTQPTQPLPPHPISSTSSLSSNGPHPNLPNPLSPRQQAALAAAAGLSPRRRSAAAQTGSDTSPSMGSSFSDLDDASVTQSALEEALMSGMGSTTNAIGTGPGPGPGSMASRVSGISQALRSRYLDVTRGGAEQQR